MQEVRNWIPACAGMTTTARHGFFKGKAKGKIVDRFPSAVGHKEQKRSLVATLARDDKGWEFLVLSVEFLVGRDPSAALGMTCWGLSGDGAFGYCFWIPACAGKTNAGGSRTAPTEIIVSLALDAFIMSGCFRDSASMEKKTACAKPAP